MNRPREGEECILRAMLRALPMYLILAGVGALATFTEKPVAWQTEGGSVAPLWLNVLAGVLGGLFAAALMHRITAAVTRRVEAGESVAFLNGGVMGLIGALFGLVGYLILELLFIRSLWLHLAEAGLIFFLTFLGFRIGYSRENVLLALVGGERPPPRPHSPKILDTSVIIDGRIGDLVKTGFVEGQIIVPQFILDELHSIADSADNLRRRKGRRGLDILGELRGHPHIEVGVLDRDYPDIAAVDRKLIQLAKELDAKLITTDFNLNKVAKVEGITILNINELANAIKPRFIPGEELEVEVIDRGEEIGQGIGYLDDGTMVVVENGRRFIGKKIRATVSSSLQTEAGKMLFVRPKGEVNGGWDEP